MLLNKKTEIDMSKYVSINDLNDKECPTLTTTDKTLIGSINEVNSQVELIPVVYGYDSGMVTINFENFKLKPLFDMGGYLHFVINIGVSTMDIPVLFDKNNLLSYTTYQDMPEYYINQTQAFMYATTNSSGSTTSVAFKFLNIYCDLREKYLINGDRDVFFYIEVYDSMESKDSNHDITFSVSNVYFEPRNIPESKIIQPK